MKNLTIFIGLFPFLFTATMSVASEPLPAHWEVDGKVYFAPRPSTTAQLLIFKESERSWAYLQVHSDYGSSVATQMDSLRRMYPGREVHWIRAEAIGKARLTLSALDVNQESEWIPRSSGPAASFSMLLSRSETEKLKSRPGSIQVNGRISVKLRTTRNIEEVILSPEVCDSLISEPADMGNVLIRFAALAQKLDRRVTRYPETKSSLKLSVLKECIEHDSIPNVRSFSQLLSTRVYRKEMRSSPRGETRMEGEVVKEADFVSSPSTTLEIVGS